MPFSNNMCSKIKYKLYICMKAVEDPGDPPGAHSPGNPSFLQGLRIVDLAPSLRGKAGSATRKLLSKVMLINS